MALFDHLQYSQLSPVSSSCEKGQSAVNLTTSSINLTLVRLHGEEARFTANHVQHIRMDSVSVSGERLDKMKGSMRNELHTSVAVWETMHIWQQEQVRIIHRFYHR